nr:universal stress protein [Streptomyces sp. QL37]PPQ62268.1 universal stress protein [Streptomyces sp. QL37]
MRPRVVAGVSGRPDSPAVLQRAAAEARLRGAELLAVMAWDIPGADGGGRHGVGFSSSLPQCRADGAERLRDALGAAFGAPGAGVPVTGRAVRGTPGAVLVDAVGAEDVLLVVGTGSRNALHRFLWPSVARHCLAHAPCPVLAVPPSPLRTALATARRRNALGLRLDTRELTGPGGV